MSTTDADPSLVVARLAAARDADDFDTVSHLLARDCVYTIGEAIQSGPEAITASYRQGSVLAHRLFEAVAFSHQIVAVNERTVLVDFEDVLTYRGDLLVHHSLQEFTVSRGGVITGISDVSDPSEGAKVQEFETRHGLRR